jgi:hypothetical protein
VVFSSDNVPMQEEVAARCGVRKPRLMNGSWQARVVPGLHRALHGTRPFAGGAMQCNTYTAFSYVPYYIALRVADDARWGIDAFVRGMDLVSEVSLYDWFCCLAGVRSVAQLYVPLFHRQGGGKQCTDSRTTLRELRAAGYDGPAVLDTLIECASRAMERGLEAVPIPEGVLEVGDKPRRTLPFDNDELRRDALRPQRADMPFPAEIVALNAERHAQVLRGERHGLSPSAPESLKHCFDECAQEGAEHRHRSFYELADAGELTVDVPEEDVPQPGLIDETLKLLRERAWGQRLRGNRTGYLATCCLCGNDFAPGALVDGYCETCRKE